MFTLIPLGINGFIPTFNRHTMSYLLYDDSDELILLDAGSGVSRLIEPSIKQRISSKKRLNIILSHYHLDHVIGLSYLPGVWPEKPIRLFAPGKPFVDAIAEDVLCQLLNPPLFPLSFKDFPNSTELISLSDAEYTIGSHVFQFKKLQHPGGSMGMKIDNTVAYITDTGVSNEYNNFIKNIPCLLHEVWMTREEARERPEVCKKHSVLEEVVSLAETSHIEHLIPIHFHPLWTEEKILNSFKQCKNSTVKITIPVEGKQIPL